jgi:hypothetical protein
MDTHVVDSTTISIEVNYLTAWVGYLKCIFCRVVGRESIFVFL